MAAADPARLRSATWGDTLAIPLRGRLSSRTMENSPPASDFFDWVEARLEWSAAKVFDQMADLARAQVAALNQHPNVGFVPFLFHREGVYLYVGRQTSNMKDLVRFHVDGEAIWITQGDADALALTPTIDSDGRRCLRVGDRRLAPWQAMREVLEPLFFRQF